MSNAVQPENAVLLRDVICEFDSKVIFESATQFENAPSPIDEQFAGITIVASLTQFENIFDPNAVRAQYLPKVKVVRDEQSANIESAAKFASE